MYKNLLISVIVLLSCSKVVKSQQSGSLRNPKLGIGVEADLGDNKYGAGYSLNFQSPITRSLNWTVTLGKTNLQSTLKVMLKPKYENLTAKVGVKYFLNEHLYVSGDIGAAFNQIQRRNTRFAWSPGIGVEMHVFGKSALDIGGKYEVYQSANSLKFFALKMALNLGL